MTLAHPTSPGNKAPQPFAGLEIVNFSVRHSPDGVDVRSCVLSLVDLFSHWLTQPLQPLLLQQTLRATLMISDLFSLVH